MSQTSIETMDHTDNNSTTRESLLSLIQGQSFLSFTGMLSTPSDEFATSDIDEFDQVSERMDVTQRLFHEYIGQGQNKILEDRNTYTKCLTELRGE
jgi:hypothetical protein